MSEDWKPTITRQSVEFLRKREPHAARQIEALADRGMIEITEFAPERPGQRQETIVTPAYIKKYGGGDGA